MRYYDRIIDKPTAKIFIVMEYCEGGDLGRMLKKYRAERELIPEERIWRLFTQIVAAIH